MHENVKYTNQSDIANVLNEYFSSIAKKLSDEFPLNHNIPHTRFMNEELTNSMILFPITTAEVLKLIHGLKLTKTDINTIPVHLFKKISELIVNPLCRLINVCFRNGVFPDALKIARITPIFKKGDKKDPSNYRPIASLPYLSKIFERCLHNRIISFLDKYSVLSRFQFGFRKNRTTSDALVELTESIYRSLDNNFHHCCISLDLKKAFDTVDHDILLNKLRYYGIRGTPLKLLRSYLSNRVQYLRIGSSESSVVQISIGVPQGSILGPLLFLLYVNDLPQLCNSLKSQLFADDTMLSFSQEKSTLVSPSFYIDLKLVTDWLKSNKLTVNFTKTHLINFSLGPNRLFDNAIALDDQTINNNAFCDYLGVRIDEKLNFGQHTGIIMGKISKSTGILYKLKELFPTQSRIDYYCSFIYPFLSYCVLIWGGTYDVHLKEIIIKQKKVVRLIAGAPYNSPSTPLFFRFKILKFEDLYRFNLAIYMYKNQSQFQCSHSINTRNRHLAVPPYHRLTVTQHSVSYKGPQIWNKLPLEIRSLNSITKFKKAVKEHFLNSYA